MDPPDEKGTYVLIASVPRMKRIGIGQLGDSTSCPAFTLMSGVRSEPVAFVRVSVTTWNQLSLHIGI